MSDSGPWITSCPATIGSSLGAALANALDEAAEPDAMPNLRFLEIEGMSGWRYRLLINSLVRQTPNARYLEVGVWAGSTLCSAIAGNEVRAVAVDDWSQFGGPRDEFLANLSLFDGPEVRFIESDFRDLDFAAQGRFNIYMFDGPHTETDQRDGIGIALGALDNEFVLIVDDWNWPDVRAGTRKALAEFGLEEVGGLEIRTTLDDSHPPHSGFDAKTTEWHNGYLVTVLRKPERSENSLRPATRRLTEPIRQKAQRRADTRAQSAAEAHASAPENTEVLVLVTHHHDQDRVDWLSQTVAAIETWPARRRDVVVVTNTSDDLELKAIRSCAPSSPREGFSLEVVTASNLVHPHDLPWAQKPILRDRFLARDATYTHVVSLEDDIAVGAEAFLYWICHRPLLAPYHLIPSFVRVEYRSGDTEPYATDSPRANTPAARPAVRAGAYDFIALDKPYSATFIMDRPLAEEYAASPSFDQGSSMAASIWRTRERATMGLCWESPPTGFAARHVVPVDRAVNAVAECAHVCHLPANYANDPTSGFAKIPVRDLLAW